MSSQRFFVSWGVVGGAGSTVAPGQDVTSCESPPGCPATRPQREQRLQPPVSCDRGGRLPSRARLPAQRSLRALLAGAEDPAPSVPASSLVVPSQGHCGSAPRTPPAPDARAGLRRGGRDRAGEQGPEGGWPARNGGRREGCPPSTFRVTSPWTDEGSRPERFLKRVREILPSGRDSRGKIFWTSLLNKCATREI